MDLEPNNWGPATEREVQYRDLLNALPVAVYATDASGRVVRYNQEAAELLGHTPEPGEALRCKIFWPDGRPMRAEESPLAVTLRTGRPLRGREMIIERADGSRRHVMTQSRAMHNQAGETVGAVHMLEDITERKQWEKARSMLSAIVESSDDAIISKDLSGVIRSWNAGAQRIFGYAAEEVVGRHISILIPDDRQDEEPSILSRLIRGERIDHYETVRKTKDGRHINISISVSPLRDSGGAIVGASKIARDITERKRTEAELASYRELLEQKVQARTAELEQSMQQLRVTERIVSLGTLAVGLGHDMANVLVPLRVRLESLSRADLSKELRTDVEAIGYSAVYLQRLANGLRLLAVDPRRASRAEATSLLAWWDDVEPMFRNVLPKGVELAARFPARDCTVAMSRAALMQVVFNLVQNSGDAMKERGTGHVVVSAEPVGDQVRMTVSDNGPGMTPEVARRCMEPYFSTKVRGTSTGMGLVVVCGLMRDAGGSVALESKLGVGTTFTLNLPSGHSASASEGPPRVAVVKVKDARIGAFIAAEFRAQSFNVHSGTAPAGAPDVYVTDDPESVPAEWASSAVVVLGKPARGKSAARVIDLPLKPQAVRDVVHRLSREVHRDLD